jgi:hypothetical protein
MGGGPTSVEFTSPPVTPHAVREEVPEPPERRPRRCAVSASGSGTRVPLQGRSTAARPPSGGRARQRRAPRRRRHPPPSVTVSGSHLWISPRLEKWGGERSKKERGGGRGHEPALLPLTLAGELPAMGIAEPAAIAAVRRHRWRWGSG